ncbi:hypothetical protein CFC21_014621 [Triticum aestivum]|uniref:NB-ARC domain-containing protein n=2 Tax=Triticum aestivum TaxID=4565 RepID=A0A9R1DUT3_WHEAT|nr:putative disease resistance protein RGA3 [Triticum aestivum]XP_044454693.1 putative disease resistance protein RGA3 [Triticum aestivum]KAF6998506.1 hypothetical protein CFC21_014621 [Triticum aestivum]
MGPEVAVALAVVGWFVSPHITKLMEVARSCASSKYKLPRGMRKKLLKLAEDLGDIKDFLDDPAIMGGSVNDRTWVNRLWSLKDAIHDAEEILDLFESHILEAEAAKNLKKRSGGGGGSASSSGRKSAYSWWIFTTNTSGPSLNQLKEVLKNLGELRERMRELCENPTTRSAVLSPLCRAPLGPEPVREKKLFFGYAVEYEQLVSMLGDGNCKDKKVISLIGHGGMGKTELARQAYRHVRGKFDRPIWVPAYGKNAQFDLLAEIWKSAVGEKSVQEMNISSLQDKLRAQLASQRCLLVLDDVWRDEKDINESERRNALRCFTDFVGVGSRIVMTTRSRICSTKLGAQETIFLNGIKPEEMMLLLNDTANISADGTIGIQGVLKLKGSPSAAIEIGEKLKARRAGCGPEGRGGILENIECHIAGVVASHLASYDHLPPHLQRCFALCSIFPDGWRFEPEKLSKMWMALGFVEEKGMEDVARGYFQELVDRSLFELEQSKGGGDKHNRYVIHEHIHRMIRDASSKNCISISRASTADRTSIPPRVRHLSVTSGCLDQLSEYSIGLGNLRTLIVLKDDGDDDGIAAIDKDILQQFKGVRVLDLTETAITGLPASIGKLKHLRYLGLPSTVSSDLGDQVTKLVFLQTLSVGQEDKGKKRECITNISGIGRLVKLRESIEFQVMRGSEKEGHGLWELAGMKSLGKTLSIKGLEAVASKEEAKQARLDNKCSVKVLKLQWGAPDARHGEPVARSSAAADPAPAVAVLQGLQPHRYLHELRIARYPGETSPTWLSGLEKLTRLYLKNCRKLKALPALGQLPCLELLEIKELCVVARIDGGFCGGGAFPKLKKIVLDDMKELVAWNDNDMPKVAFPLLRDVSIADCPLLSSLSGLGRCTGPIHLRVKGCPHITPDTLPAAFRNGVSTCKFH